MKSSSQTIRKNAELIFVTLLVFACVAYIGQHLYLSPLILLMLVILLPIAALWLLKYYQKEIPKSTLSTVQGFFIYGSITCAILIFTDLDKYSNALNAIFLSVKAQKDFVPRNRNEEVVANFAETFCFVAPVWELTSASKP